MPPRMAMVLTPICIDGEVVTWLGLHRQHLGRAGITRIGTLLQLQGRDAATDSSAIEKNALPRISSPDE